METQTQEGLSVRRDCARLGAALRRVSERRIWVEGILQEVRQAIGFGIQVSIGGKWA
jgi:hypothetical protein